MKSIVSHTPGIIFAGIIAIAASYLGGLLPVVGGPVFAILLGVLVSNLVGKPERVSAGAAFTAKRVLQWSIILIGSSLSLSQILATGASSFFVMIITLTMAFLSSLLVGRALGVPARLTVLIGAGTGICGGSAIAAVSPIIAADEVEIGYSMSTIFAFNVIAVLLFPALGHLFGFSSSTFGMWAGTAINDTSSVVAAGYAYSNAAGDYATIVKLTRTTMIIPISLLLAIVMTIRARRVDHRATAVAGESGVRGVEEEVRRRASIGRIFPWFILGFVAMALANTLHLFPPVMIHLFTGAGRFMIVMALAAIGLNANIRKMLGAGFKPLILGLAVWATVAVSSIIVQRLLV